MRSANDLLVWVKLDPIPKANTKRGFIRRLAHRAPSQVELQQRGCATQAHGAIARRNLIGRHEERLDLREGRIDF